MKYKIAICDDSDADREYVLNMVNRWAAGAGQVVHTDTFTSAENFLFHYAEESDYDISELGLSVEAAKNLYTGKVNNDVVNRLLENPRFATVTYMIAQHLDDTLAGGYAAQNQMFATVGSLLLGQNQTPEAVQAARTANAMKVPTYQADQTTIQNTFMTVVKEIKKEAGSDLAAARAI